MDRAVVFEPGVYLPKSTDLAPRAAALATVSIEHKLPLLFGGLLLAVILGVSAFADEEMRRTVPLAASERSGSLTRQVGGVIQRGPQAGQVVATELRDSSDVVQWRGIPRSRESREGLESLIGSDLAPMNAHKKRIALLALVAAVVAFFATWVMSRRLTGALSQLAAAADAMSRGDYSQAVSIERSDELGRLGRSFNIMAAEVAQSRHGLEEMVEQRTNDLNATLQQLNDAQESLVRREKLAMLGQLASGVGHELRNPLGVMTNTVYYLKAVLASAPANVTESLGILQQQITLSEKIVCDLLDFAKLKPPIRSASSFEDIAREQIARLGVTKGVVITTDFPTNLPPVLVDSVQVGQIMLNLLTNAMQAMEHSGMITVSARANDSIVWCDVCDSGPGVASENVGKIFEPLFTTKSRGIGLGLAVSRTLARANQGELALGAAPSPGAVFRLTLPIALDDARLG